MGVDAKNPRVFALGWGDWRTLCRALVFRVEHFARTLQSRAIVAMVKSAVLFVESVNNKGSLSACPFAQDDNAEMVLAFRS